MKVTTELIEKFNRKECSASEISAIEQWLLNDDYEDEVEISEESEKQIKAEIWDEVSEVLPSKNKECVLNLFQQNFKWIAAAASVSILLVISVVLLYSFDINKQGESALIKTPTKQLGQQKQEIWNKDFNIVLGDKSKASFDSDKRLVDFCGVIKISPKKDISLSFNDICSGDKPSSKGIEFKKGETYFALNYKNQESDQLVIMNENLIFELPPLLKYELSDQFDI